MENFSIIKAKQSLSKKASGQFVKVNKTMDTSYVVLDSIGKVEMIGKLDNTRKINVQSLARGIYFIQFSNQDNSKSSQHFMKM